MLRFPFSLAAVDIDDTLLGPDRAISAGNAAAIETLRRRGVRVVLASGRSHANMLPYHRALGLEGPVISCQGAMVRVAETGEIWHERDLPPALAVELVEEGRRQGVTVQYYRRDGVHVEARTPLNDYDQGRNVDPQILVGDLLALGGAEVQKTIWLAAPERIAALAREAVERYRGRLYVTPTDPEYLEFLAPDVDKGVGLAAAAAGCGVDRSRVLAFGDGHNDVPMLAWAGLGVAMDHARPEAKAAADLVAPEGDPEMSLARAIALVLARWPGDEAA